ncbi:MAG: DMT family transporter, partial [Nocardioides sp.]
GVLLVPVALAVEGTPPHLDARAIGGFAWIGLAGTVLAYLAWFNAMRRLPAAAVSLVGLLNPVTGTVIGVALAGEAFTATHALGTALVLGGIVLGQPAILDALGTKDRRSADGAQLPTVGLERTPDRTGVVHRAG